MDTNGRRKEFLPLIICAVLFVFALGAHLLFGDSPQQAEGIVQESGVRITEIMSNNRTYSDGAGKVLDYIEVSNLTDKTLDISNYKLSDDQSAIGYTFPPGTVLPAYGSAVCWCDSQGGDQYGKFGISKDGGETVYLYNSANVVVDQKIVPPLEANQPYIRQSDGTWAIGGLASPGFANTEVIDDLDKSGFAFPNFKKERKKEN